MVINRSDVGAWIIKCNPVSYEYFAARDATEDEPDEGRYLSHGGWTLGRTYRNRLVKRGDLIALWVTGNRAPGIYEFGYVTSDKPFIADGWVREFAVDRVKAEAPHPAIEYTAVRLYDDEYISRDSMLGNPVLARAEQFRAPQMTNPTYLTPTQARALAALLADRVSKAAMREGRWLPLT